MTLVRIRARQTVSYEKVVEMPEDDLRDIRRAFNKDDERAIAGAVEGWVDVQADVQDADDLEDVEVEVVERQPDGKLKRVEELFSGENYDVGDEEDEEDDA